MLERASNNSNFGLNPAGIDASTKKVIRVRFKNETNATSLRVQGHQAADASSGQLTNTVFTIAANSSEYVTQYLDMTGVTNWDNTVDNFDVLVRTNYAGGEGNFYLDEIEFLDTMPATTYNEFIQNPSFDGPSGIAHLSGASAGASRSLTTTEQHDGTQSLRFTYTADATAHFWSFSNYEKVYGTPYALGSELEVKMWVKTNRTAPINISVRVKLSNAGDSSQTKPIQTVTTTNTTMDWEELTFTLNSTDVFDGVILFFNIAWADESGGAVAENLNNGDMVYIDQLSATITDASALSVKDNVLENVSIYPNPTSDILKINTLEGANIEIFNVLGRLVKSEKNVNAQHTMDVSGLSKGVYLVKLTSDNKSVTKKVIKN